jgi:hypothetical protein
MTILKRIREAVIGPDTADDALYDAVAKEIGAGKIQEGLWARALAESGFDELQTKSRYIVLRVAALKAEIAERRQFRFQYQKEWKRLRVAYAEKNYGGCLLGWSRLAKAGDVEAQYCLALLYVTEDWCDRNDYLAYVWAYAAAQNGHKEAANLRYSLIPKLRQFEIDEAEVEAQPWITTRGAEIDKRR